MKPVWYLEGFVDDELATWRTEIAPMPFLIGRLEDCDLQLPAAGISSHHAEIFLSAGEEVYIRDLKSTNGTFVNLDRIDQPTALQAGDVIHFADREFRLVAGREALDPDSGTLVLDMAVIESAREMLAQRPLLEEMIRERKVKALFQPVVSMTGGRRVGFELLGRGAHEGLPESPEVLLAAAKELSMEVKLTEVFRSLAVDNGTRLAIEDKLFLNTHPTELTNHEQLIGSLEQLSAQIPDRRLVLEIHEDAVADSDRFRPLRQALDELGVGVAFDDFGKGQARLIELADLVPNYVKFDRRMVAGIDRAPKRREMVRRLVGMVQEIGIETIAEGIETEAEATACTDLGFVYGQGYFYGRPAEEQAFGAEG